MRYLWIVLTVFVAVVLGGQTEDDLMGECPHARRAPRIDPPQTRRLYEWCLDCHDLVDAR